jgi:hypothetical protein
MLGFTAADGQPVMCAIIFAAKTFCEEWRTGFDTFAQWVGEPDDIAVNCGDGKQYPFGPVCVFKEKTIPCFCCCSESGSIKKLQMIILIAPNYIGRDHTPVTIPRLAVG